MGKKSKLQIKAEVILTDSKGFSVGEGHSEMKLELVQNKN